MGTKSRLSVVARHSKKNSNLKDSNGKKPELAVEEQSHGSGKESKRLEEESRKALAKATIPIEARLRSGERLWDQDFSSMSSYGSQDLEVYKIVQSVESNKLDYNSEFEERSVSLRTVTDSSANASSSSSSQLQINTDNDQEEELTRKRKEYTKLRRQRSSESLSAELPKDVAGPAKNSMALVKQSYDPYHDFRDSIREMVLENGIYEWQQLQELLYCYIKLNSPEVYHSITSAFVDVLVQLQSGTWSSSFENEECLDYDWP